MLLDAVGNAKVADFGTVHIGASATTNRTHLSTKHITGTRGYMPPEYHMNGQISEKTDSFAFGMVLLELLTGCSPSNTAMLYTGEEDLFDRMEEKYKDAKAGPCPQGVLAAVALVTKSCLSWHAQRRATIQEALPRLEAACTGVV